MIEGLEKETAVPDLSENKEFKQELEELSEQKRISLAKKKFPAKFLIKNIAREDNDQTQIMMETYISYMTNPDHVR